jgi:hypothetical protein
MASPFRAFRAEIRLQDFIHTAIGEGWESAHELGELAANLLGVVGDGLDGVALVFQRPEAFLDMALLLGQTVYLIVYEADGLGGQIGAQEPAGELFLLASDPFRLLQHRLPAGLQIRQPDAAVVVGEVPHQGGDHIAPLGQVADLLENAALQDVGLMVRLLAAETVNFLAAE